MRLNRKITSDKMKKFFLTVCCLMVASVAMAQSDTVANVKNVYVTQDADRGRILLTVGGYQVGLTSRTRPKYAAAGTVVMSEAQVERLARQNPKYLVDGCVVSEDIMKRIELRKRRSRVEVSIGFRAMEPGFQPADISRLRCLSCGGTRISISGSASRSISAFGCWTSGST